MSRSSFLMAAGAVAGVVMTAVALTGLFDRPAPLPNAGVAARVNGRPIMAEDVDSLAFAAWAGNKAVGEGVGGPGREAVLDRLIDEELLVQRALELGLAGDDPRIRGELVAAVIAMVVSRFNDAAAGREELMAFYRENLELFTAGGRLRLAQVFVQARRGGAERAREKADMAARRMRAGEGAGSVTGELGDSPLPPLPQALLPAAKLRDYLGPTATRTAMGLAVGEVSDPVRSASGFHILKLLERREAVAPPFDDIKEQVLAEYRRRLGDEALRDYLQELRRGAEISRAVAGRAVGESIGAGPSGED